MADPDLERFEPNPDYGSDIFVRAIAFQRVSERVLDILLEDPYHAFAIRMEHDAHEVTALSARWERNPLTSCTGSDLALQSMVGCPLDTDIQRLGLFTDGHANCTHMFDALRLGILHAARGRPDHRYDVVIPDSVEDTQSIQMLLDGKEIMALLITQGARIVSPPDLAGAPLMSGLARWAAGRLSERQFELLFIAQRAAFISQGQKIDIARYVGAAGRLSGPAAGTCHGSRPSIYGQAVRIGNYRRGLRQADALQFGIAQAGK